MLVKFLSFVATVFGTARYKAVLLSSLTLLLSVSGILAVVMTARGDSTPQHDASAVIRNATDALGAQDGGAVATPYTEQPASTPAQSSNAPEATPTNTQASTATPQNTTSGNSTTTTTATTPTITTTAKTPVALTAGQTSSVITYTTSDSSSVTWTITTSDTSGTSLTVSPTPSNQASSSVSFQVTAASNAQSGSYTVTVTAKGTNGSIAPSTFSVTVQ